MILEKTLTNENAFAEQASIQSIGNDIPYSMEITIFPRHQENHRILMKSTGKPMFFYGFW